MPKHPNYAYIEVDGKARRVEVVAAHFEVVLPNGETRLVPRSELKSAPRETPIESNEFNEQVHPSFGMARLSRTSGSRPLFGSQVRSHEGYMTLRIYEGSRTSRHGEDTYRAAAQST